MQAQRHPVTNVSFAHSTHTCAHFLYTLRLCGCFAYTLHTLCVHMYLTRRQRTFSQLFHPLFTGLMATAKGDYNENQRGEYNGNQRGNYNRGQRGEYNGGPRGAYRGNMRGQRGDHSNYQRSNQRGNQRGDQRGNQRYNNQHRNQGREHYQDNKGYNNRGREHYQDNQGYNNQGQGYNDYQNNNHDMNAFNHQFQRSINFDGQDQYGVQQNGNRGHNYRNQPRGGVQEHGHGRKPEYDHGFVSLNKKILGENVFRLLIRERNVKVVLGPKGENIKKIKEMCKGDCKVTIYTQSANGEPFPEGSVDRVVCVETSMEDIEKVLMEMIPHFQTYPPAKMVGKFNEIRLLVPDFTCSSIIGPKGDHVKNIQRDLRSFVQVHKNPAPSSTEHVVSLTNREVGALAMSAAQIYR